MLTNDTLLPNDSSHKSSARRIQKELLAQLTEEEVRTKSAQITGRLTQTSLWRKACLVLSYYDFRSEVATDLAFHYGIQQNKIFYYPAIENTDLIFRRVLDLQSDFETGPWGIKQPRKDLPPLEMHQGTEHDPTLILVPGLGFSPFGARLGRGKGFYDRFLCGLSRSVPRIGLCFEVQIMNPLIKEKHDQDVDLVITEDSIFGL